MREYLTSADVANTVCMMRSAFNGTILVVEGITDFRLYGKFTVDGEVEMVIAHSKDKVKESVHTCNGSRGDRKVLGITDSDLDILKHGRSEGPVFETDTRDAESLIVMSEAFDSVLWEYGDRESVKEFRERYGDIRKRVLDAAYPVGLLMYISSKRSLSLSFKDLDFGRFIDSRSLSCDTGSLIREVLGNTKYRRTDSASLRGMLSDEMRRNHPPESVCRGHDLVDVLVIGFRETFGAYNSKDIRSGELGGALRMAYDLRMFSQTDLYKDTMSWCMKQHLALWREYDTQA